MEGITIDSLKKWFSGLLLLILFFSCALPTLTAVESNPKITGSEIERIRQITQRLQQLNTELTQKLQQSNADLANAQTELAKYKAELENVTQQLSEASTTVDNLKKELEEAQQLLVETNQKLEDYQKKVEKEIKRLKLQRNIAALVAILVLILK